MEIPEGLKTLRWADDIALLKAEFKDEIAVKRLNRLGMLIEALKAENEELRKERDELINGLQYLDALHNELGIVDLTKETERCREIAKKVNKNGNA